MEYEIIPSLMAAGDCQEALDMLEGHVDRVHIDVMDGIFVEKKMFGLDEVTKLETSLKMTVHLMTVKPDMLVADYALAGADTIIFHIESEGAPEDTIKLIRDENCSAGISLNPETPLERIKGLLGRVDLVLVMAVEPGRGGQKLLPGVAERVKELRSMSRKIDIAVDGGVSRKNIHMLKEAGANKFAVGTGIFSAEDPLKEIEELKRKIL